MNPLKFLLLTMVLILSMATWAQQVTYDGHEFASEQQRQTYEQLTKELRCPKCQNQNIADSNARLAADMRERAYEMLMAGRSKQEIIDYMVARYGNFAHYKPPFNAFTAILWLAPLLIALGGVVLAFRLSRKRRQPVALSEQEKYELEQLQARSDND